MVLAINKRPPTDGHNTTNSFKAFINGGAGGIYTAGNGGFGGGGATITKW
jgi:hypothetical protein